MSNKYIDIDLNREQKFLVQEKTSFFIFSDCTKEDLNNKRKKWIRFERLAISDIIGELSYYYNRSENEYESMLLDELICHLELYEKDN